MASVRPTCCFRFSKASLGTLEPLSPWSLKPSSLHLMVTPDEGFLLVPASSSDMCGEVCSTLSGVRLRMKCPDANCSQKASRPKYTPEDPKVYVLLGK